ncbi:MAG: hypothetical protein K2X87_18940 [Gemmataceae bacterium]|nr:hypothetical protein [Gemmataceae bacterium]
MTMPPDAATAAVLVSDFDGTMTRHDFYRLAIESLLPPDTPDHWADYRAGTITHFEALWRYFAAVRVGKGEPLAAVRAAPGVKERFYTALSGRDVLPEVEHLFRTDPRLVRCFRDEPKGEP